MAIVKEIPVNFIVSLFFYVGTTLKIIYYHFVLCLWVRNTDFFKSGSNSYLVFDLENVSLHLFLLHNQGHTYNNVLCLNRKKIGMIVI